jgi:hypothetical protein
MSAVRFLSWRAMGAMTVFGRASEGRTAPFAGAGGELSGRLEAASAKR